MLTGAGRSFSLAYQLSILEHGPLLDAIIERAGPPDRPTRNLLKVSLANYLAAAVLMPYAAFQESAERSGYDIELMRSRFGVSFEQACHRLTTLSRPGLRGVPFFLLRVDSAGNIIPELAESWTVSDDAKEVTYKLRDDAKFADGSPVEASDVEAPAPTAKAAKRRTGGAKKPTAKKTAPRPRAAKAPAPRKRTAKKSD